ncbi:MAG: amino acid permease [Prolixibacteraceae bacterium]|nr:amino acid permease [Prolixibacteraceae bacterium]
MPEEKLHRKLGLFSLSNIVVANMVGAGIFLTSGLIIESVNNAGLMLLLWFIAGIIAFSGAISYGELGATYPKAGGEFIFLSEIFHPLVGFLSGWVSFIVGFSAPVAASAMGFSEYFTRVFPELLTSISQSSNFSVEFINKGISIFVILLFTLIHLRGIEKSAAVQNILTILKIALVVGLIIIGILWGKGDWSHFQQTKLIQENTGSWRSIGLSLMWIMFAYSGWNASTYIGSEIRKPSKNIPNSLLLGTGLVILLYLGLNTFFIYAIPIEEMKGVISVGGVAVNYAFGEKMDAVFSLLISFALFSSLSAYLILGPRVTYSMAQKGYFFKSVAKINPKTKVPSLAILLQAVISIIMVLSGTFDQILTYLGFSLGIFPILAVVGVFKIRVQNKSKIKLKGYPFVQLLFILSSLAILTLSFSERPIESSIAIATIIVGIPFFYLLKVRK